VSDSIKLEVVAPFVTPDDRPVMGEKRLVRLLPAGLPGTKGNLFPCVWMSPYEMFDEDLKENVKFCLLLINKGPPKPEIWGIRIPAAAIEKFPTGPIEW
jgi:hypothetical protein